MIFECKWFDLFDRRRFVRYGLDSEIYSIGIHREVLTTQVKPFVLPQHFEYALLHLDVSKEN